MRREYHVSKRGSDKNEGTKEAPFLTIQRAADIAAPGDIVIVHEGEYREWVRPRNGGVHESLRITYEAAEGEHVVIKGFGADCRLGVCRGECLESSTSQQLFWRRKSLRTGG